MSAQVSQQNKETPSSSCVVTANYLVEQLKKYTLERKYALLSYPDAKGSREKLLAIDEILACLTEAKQQTSTKATAKQVLRQSLNLHFIAPTATRMLYQRWYDKIEDIMRAFRDVLNWRSQNG